MPNPANKSRKSYTKNSPSSNQANRANQGGEGSTQDGGRTHYAHQVVLKLNGSPAPDELMNDILEVIVKESLHMPSTFVLKIHNVAVGASENTEPWRNEKYFKIGDPISIGFDAGTTEDDGFVLPNMEERIIDGEITGIQVDFTNKSEAHIVVRGHEISHRLHRGRYSRTFLNQTDSAIVERIAKLAEIGIDKVTSTDVEHKYVCQENQTNMEFLQERAANIGFELFVRNNEMYFRKPTSEGSIELKWLKDVTRFDVRVDSAEQVSSVQVNSWDYSQKKLITETASKEKLVTETGNSTGSSNAQKFKTKQPPKMTVVDRPVDTAKEAGQMAQALCDELGGKFVNADAQAYGNPEIRPGKVAELTNLGTRYSGKYYITGTCHHYVEGSYKTSFSIRELGEGDLPSTLPSKFQSLKTRLRPSQTFLIGIVSKNKDPKGWGRVKVEFPNLGIESNWARVVSLGAANKSGFYCLPEIHDEVLVCFENGKNHRPIILGGLWNGKDKTVETVADTIKNRKVRVRTIRTRTGHEIRFVEENGKKDKAGIYIKTSEGHRIDINDSQKCIEIKTKGRNRVSLNDTKSIVSVKTKKGQSLTFLDIGMITTLRTTGTINVNGAAAVNIGSSGAVNVNAGGAANVTAGGAASINAGGVVSIKAGGMIDLASTAGISLKSTNIRLSMPPIIAP